MTQPPIFHDPEFVYQLPHCPPEILTGLMQSPSTFVLQASIAAIATVLGAVTFILFNSVTIPIHTLQAKNIRVSSKGISNTMWVLYFSCVALRGVVDAFRYGKPVKLADDDSDQEFLFIMEIISQVVHGFTCVFLILALNYQRRYRTAKINSILKRLSLKHGGLLIPPKRNSYDNSHNQHTTTNSSRRHEGRRSPSESSRRKKYKKSISDNIVHDEDVHIGDSPSSSIPDEQDPQHHPQTTSSPPVGAQQRRGIRNIFNSRRSDSEDDEDEDRNKNYYNRNENSDEEEDDDDDDDEDEVPDSMDENSVNNYALREKNARERFFHFFISVEMIVILFFLIFISTIYIRATNFGNHAVIYRWVQFGSIVLQRLPIIAIAFYILITPSKKVTIPGTKEEGKRAFATIADGHAAEDSFVEEDEHSRDNSEFVDKFKTNAPSFRYVGPTPLSKFLLVVATLLNLPSDVPLSYWYLLFSQEFITKYQKACSLYIASFYDVVTLLYLLSLFFWFWFLRREYIRQQEDTFYRALEKTIMHEGPWPDPSLMKR